MRFMMRSGPPKKASQKRAKPIAARHRLGPEPLAPTRETPTQKRRRVRRLITELDRAHPDAKLALDFSNPLELLVALILAAQSRDERVNVVTKPLFRKYPAAADFAAARPKVLERAIAALNFYRTKARSIRSACAEIVERFGGNVPDTIDELLELPGVGRKTANVLLGNAFGRPAIGVDTHVRRVSQRLGLTAHDEPDDIEPDLVALVPPAMRVRFCHLLQYHGRRICEARKPRCPDCPVISLCPYPFKTGPEELSPARPASRSRRPSRRSR